MKRRTPNRVFHRVGSMLCLSIWIAAGISEVNAFCPRPALPVFSPARINRIMNHHQWLSHLCMASSKSLNNKQAALRQKMEQAKRQNEKEAESSRSLSDEEIRQRNDRLRFEELLQKGAAAINSSDDGGYLSRKQEEEEIDAFRK
jgi:hypothetical protein